MRGQFWSVYVPSDLADPHAAVTMTLEQIDTLFALVRAHPDRLELARTADDVERIAATGKVASMIGVEGGQSIGSSLGALRILAGLGAGYLTLTHNDDTPWADSGTGERAHGGLTTFGEEVVRELNRLGMLVDLSHVSEDTMRQAIEVSQAPVFFSHSNARALCDVPRNVPDDVIELVGRTGGVICATFVPWFLTAEGAEANEAEWRETRRLRAEHPDDPDAVRAAVERFEEAQPTPRELDRRRRRSHRPHPRPRRDRPRRRRERLRRAARHARRARGRVHLPRAVRRAGRSRLHRRRPREGRRPQRAPPDARS